MKQCMILTILFLMILGSCGRKLESLPVMENPRVSPQIEVTQPQSTGKSSAESKSSEDDNTMTSITITVGSSDFSAKVYDNDTATAFLARFPMTLNMYELNGNEKYYYLSDSLPTDSKRVGSINTGDLMLYGSDCLVLFYESFSTSYSYTKLGYIEDVSGLADVLGSGSAEVVFTVSE